MKYSKVTIQEKYKKVSLEVVLSETLGKILYMSPTYQKIPSNIVVQLKNNFYKPVALRVAAHYLYSFLLESKF